MKTVFIQKIKQVEIKNYINKFKNGSWMQQAKDILTDATKIEELKLRVVQYLPKKELNAMKDEILLLCNYVTDIVSRKYTNYDGAKLILIVAALIYLVSLVDIIPDWLPLGLIDDSTIIMWVFSETKEELRKYSEIRCITKAL